MIISSWQSYKANVISGTTVIMIEGSNIRREGSKFQVNVMLLFYFMYSIAVMRASYLTLKVNFWSK
jgi:hypothetical protein